jgi:hypothetical protein
MANNIPFRRARLMMAQIAAIMASVTGPLAQNAAIGALGPYVSRGKGKSNGKGHRAPHGAQMANIRAARKLRNVKRHHAACKGH